MTLHRRSFIGGLAASVMATSVARAGSARTPDALLDRAIDWAGGAEALSKAKRIEMFGHATVRGGGRKVKIRSFTSVQPFGTCLSRSWLVGGEPSAPNMLIVTPESGTVSRNGGKTVAMPPAMLAHERAQFAIYAYLTLVGLRDPGATIKLGDRERTLDVTHPQAPATRLRFDGGGRLTDAWNSVPSPDGEGAPIPQHFEFSGEIESAGVRWPREISIRQNGRRNFDLTIDRLVVSAR